MLLKKKVKERQKAYCHSYIRKLFENRVHLELGCFAIVDAEPSGLLVFVLVHFLQRSHKKKTKNKKKRSTISLLERGLSL